MRGIFAMTHTANHPTQHEDGFASPSDDCTHYNKIAREASPLQGRLILVLEHELSPSSRESLHRLLKKLVLSHDITMISGLSRASVLQAEQMGHGLFYNRRDYLAPEDACALLPWREVWVIAEGRVWALQPQP